MFKPWGNGSEEKDGGWGGGDLQARSNFQSPAPGTLSKEFDFFLQKLLEETTFEGYSGHDVPFVFLFVTSSETFSFQSEKILLVFKT